MHQCYETVCYGIYTYSRLFVSCDQSLYGCMVSEDDNELALFHPYCSMKPGVGVQNYIWCNEDEDCVRDDINAKCVEKPKPPKYSGFSSTIVIVIVVAVITGVVGIAIKYCRNAYAESRTNDTASPSLTQRNYHLAAPNDNMTAGSRALTPSSYARSPRSQRNSIFGENEDNVSCRLSNYSDCEYGITVSRLEPVNPSPHPSPSTANTVPAVPASPNITFDPAADPSAPPPSYDSLFTES